MMEVQPMEKGMKTCVIDGATGGYTGMQYANDARGMKGWRNNMEVGGTGTFTTVRGVAEGEELLFAYDKGGRGEYWKRWGKRKVATEREGYGAMDPPQTPNTPNPNTGTDEAAEREYEGGERQSKDDEHEKGNQRRRCSEGGSEERARGRGDGEAGEGERERSGGINGKRVRAMVNADPGPESRSGGKRVATSSDMKRAKRNAGVQNRASAAVVSALERRMQQVEYGRGEGGGGGTWFERGEGGGVT